MNETLGDFMACYKPAVKNPLVGILGVVGKKAGLSLICLQVSN